MLKNCSSNFSFPDQRMEDFVYEKLDRKKKERLTHYETLGNAMVDAGNDFGPGTSYGRLLLVFCFVFADI